MPTRDQFEDGERSRRAFGELQLAQWGPYHLNGIRLIFQPKDDFIFVVYLYASINTEGLWFYGIQSTDWSRWTKLNYLAFLMRDADGVTSALLDPQESKRLLDLHEPKSNGDKKLHIRRPKNMGQIYFDKWPEFPLSAKLRRLNTR